MSSSYEDYEREYQAALSRVRSFLAGTRNRSTLSECERLLSDAKLSATAMQGLAEVEGNAMRTREAQMKLERDVTPLAREVKRALDEMGREELFYRAPDIDMAQSSDIEALIQSSDSLLQESQAVLAETEQIGSNTLQQMGRQREQLQGANSNLDAVLSATIQAKNILKSIGRKILRNRISLYCLIALLTWANMYVIYRIYKKNHSRQEDDDDGNEV